MDCDSDDYFTNDAFKIIMSDNEIKASRRCIDEMIRLGG